MIRYLIARPIGTSMVLLGVFALGILAMHEIPVSLLPDIDIPRITVHIDFNSHSAEEIETNVVSALRRELMQVSKVQEVNSQTIDGSGIIDLTFVQGVNTELAFIEVNERVDRSLPRLPREMPRPEVVRTSVSDIPIMNIDVSLRSSATNSNNEASISPAFIELSNLCETVIRRRLEQLEEIALVDISGAIQTEFVIEVKLPALLSLNISPQELKDIIRTNHTSLGNLVVNNGQYQYTVRLDSKLRSTIEIENINITVNGRVLKLKDIAVVRERPRERSGAIVSNGTSSLSLAIIKQSKAQTGQLKANLSHLIAQLRKEYPEVIFEVKHDQTALLDYSISNLNQDLIFGCIASLLIMSLFIGDFKASALICLSLPLSLILCIILFYVCQISINIISLSGLVLGIGMMIDNSIIVIDNITQYLSDGRSLTDACISAPAELFRPMLTSVFTTCAVFVPLTFLSGMAGALFFDEAVAVSVGALVSLLVSVTIIPVYYHLINRYKPRAGRTNYKISSFEHLYEISVIWTLRNKTIAIICVIALLVIGSISYAFLPKNKFPRISKNEFIATISWNESMDLTENRARILKVLDPVMKDIETYTLFLGKQDFLLRRQNLDVSQLTLYCKVKTADKTKQVASTIRDRILSINSQSTVEIGDAENIFNAIFPEESPLIAFLYPKETVDDEQVMALQDILTHSNRICPNSASANWQSRQFMILSVDREKLSMLNIDLNAFASVIRSTLSGDEVIQISDRTSYIPLVIDYNMSELDEVLKAVRIYNNKGDNYALNDFVSKRFKSMPLPIQSGSEGQYFKINLKIDEDDARPVMDGIVNIVESSGSFGVKFGGAVFHVEEMLNDIITVLLASTVLLFIILVVQFESFWLPLIILIEIPIDIAGAFIFLQAFQSGINVMSLLGIVVMGGIIINDSILKIDVINEKRSQGLSLVRSVISGGKRRFKSIIMTSLTTVLGMIPLIFTSGLGAELQAPLVLALAGGMIIGTMVSLYIIPLCYLQFIGNGPAKK